MGEEWHLRETKYAAGASLTPLHQSTEQMRCTPVELRWFDQRLCTQHLCYLWRLVVPNWLLKTTEQRQKWQPLPPPQLLVRLQPWKGIDHINTAFFSAGFNPPVHSLLNDMKKTASVVNESDRPSLLQRSSPFPTTNYLPVVQMN